MLVCIEVESITERARYEYLLRSEPSPKSR